ncbi:nucleoside hydrolase [Streptomyces sp. NPDC001185]|uniref:nucleoside hydrolase n=1 Tax=Streptomyces sp. NPDC001185 TaxID=3154380 RepID=UPI0033211456
MVLDCDPGLDDALALMLALGDPEISLRAVTTVSGNVDVDSTTRNALALREFLGFPHLVVARGASSPLKRPPVYVPHLHGEQGIGAVRLPEPTLPASDRTAPDLLVELIGSSPGEIHLVATGPLTNIALALDLDPGLPGRVASFTIMGGSFTRGNVTPAAEFNAFVDPEAARTVFAAGWQTTMVGLDLTAQARAGADVLRRMAALGPLGRDVLVPLATYLAAHDGVDRGGQILHDLCAVAYAARPDLFTTRAARVNVETAGEFTSGMTVVDFKSPGPNALVPVTLDVEGFWDYVVHSYGLLAGRLATSHRHS